MAQHRKNILVSVVGMTPQVVTETLYALMVKQSLKFSEIYVLTTSEGKNTIEGKKSLNPLADEIEGLSQTYGVELPTFSIDKNCVIVEDEAFQVADIDSGKKSLVFFNAMTEFVRNLSGDSNSAIHCSIAGGRKTMGLAAGYAMSLFGRPQDTLSHVLASKELEDSRKFFPEPGHDAEKVVLVEIPFIRLRDFIDIELSKGSYSDFVSLAQTRVDIRTGDFGAKFGIIGHSPKMMDVFSTIENYSKSDYPILIIGETGTGKEL
ncbi:MAG: TIGR02584 family CRISPR-associated protein, partial [Nitrososphaerota archaeon]|nr:TIGR02584 family CRISPR-associated protein [Nitrososphaerota archaeon]